MFDERDEALERAARPAALPGIVYSDERTKVQQQSQRDAWAAMKSAVPEGFEVSIVPNGIQHSLGDATITYRFACRFRVDPGLPSAMHECAARDAAHALTLLIQRWEPPK
jgi:hypothetical protein